MPNTNPIIWQPIDPRSVCTPHANINACTNFALIYLQLLATLYGGSQDIRVQEKIGVEEEEEDGNRDEDNGQSNEEFDFIVVGAGSAGCVVANRLTENEDWKVLLLEAGPEQPDVSLVPALTTALYSSNIDWSYRIQPNGKSCLARGGRCAWPRGKVMGGSSTINSMAYVVGNRADFDQWASMGNEGWSYKDVLPFFKKFEKNLNIEGLNRKYHGVDGPQPVARWPFIDDPSIMLTEAFNEGGLPIRDFNGEEQLGTMQAQNTGKNGMRQSTNTAYIQPIRYKRKNLTIRPNSEAVKILFDKHKRAYGIQYSKDDKLHIVTARKEVIISGGAINSPKLLLLSGIGPKQDLKNLHIPVVKDLPVGNNLHDHVTFNGINLRLTNKTATAVGNIDVLHFVEEFRHLVIKTGPLAADGSVNSVSFYKTEPDLIAPDIQYQCNAINIDEWTQEPILSEDLAFFPTSFYTGVIPRTMLLTPKSRGKLYLNASDPYGAPILDPNYFGDPRDIDPLIKGARFLISLENTHAFRSRGVVWDRTPLPACKYEHWGTDEHIECLARSYTSTPFHPVGTCKMGPTVDTNAVVDPRLRVYGVSGLRVIDASIMPVVTRGNTNAPSIMIGEKGVHMVIEDWLYNYRKH